MTGFMFPEGKGASTSNIVLVSNLGCHMDVFRWGIYNLPATQFLSKQENWGLYSTQTHSKIALGSSEGTAERSHA